MDGEPLLLVNITVSPMLDAGEIPVGLLEGVLVSAYRAKRKKPAVMDLMVTGDPDMAKLNRRHLGKDNATDVLAFDDGEMEDGRLRLGDVAISANMAKRVSGSRGVPFEHELVFYALHGLFHLLGMRDGSMAERAKMHEAQAAAMRGFGMEPAEGLLGLEEK